MEKYILVVSLEPEHRSYNNNKHIQLIMEQAEGVLVVRLRTWNGLSGRTW